MDILLEKKNKKEEKEKRTRIQRTCNDWFYWGFLFLWISPRHLPHKIDAEPWSGSLSMTSDTILHSRCIVTRVDNYFKRNIRTQHRSIWKSHPNKITATLRLRMIERGRERERERERDKKHLETHVHIYISEATFNVRAARTNPRRADQNSLDT